MANDPMKEDRELDIWREEWSSVAPPSPEFQRRVQEKIKVHDRRFWLGNLLAVAALLWMLILAVYQLSHPASRLEKGSAIGLIVLLFVSAASRLWFMRGTWRTETRSIRAFVELWQRRVLSQIRGLQIGIYIAIGWLVFCAALAAANWATVWLELMAHPASCLALTLIILLVLPLIWFGVMRLRRSKVAELNAVTKLLKVMEASID
jgi:flagellar biogenesis protein FliO